MDNVALAINGNAAEPIYFSNIDPKYGYSQMKLSDTTSRQANFGIVGGKITGTYRFKIVDKPYEFQRIMDSLLGRFPGIHVFLDERLIATRGSAERHLTEVTRTLEVLDSIKAEVKWSKCTFFVKEFELLGFRLSTNGTVPIEKKVESIVKMKQSENIIRFIRFIPNHQFIRFIPNHAAKTEPFWNLMRKLFRFEWNDSHEKNLSSVKNYCQPICLKSSYRRA